MAFYGGLANVASNLLKSKGQNLTFTRKTISAHDPKAGVVQSNPSTYTGYGAAFDYNRKEIDGTLVKRGDIRLILEATTTAPDNGDTVTIDSVIYRIMSVKPTSPAGTVVIYEVQLRR